MPILRPGPFARLTPPQFFLNDPDDWSIPLSGSPNIGGIVCPVNRGLWDGIIWPGRFTFFQYNNNVGSIPSNGHKELWDSTGNEIQFSVSGGDLGMVSSLVGIQFFYVSTRDVNLELDYYTYAESTYSGSLIGSVRLELDVRMGGGVVFDFSQSETGTGTVSDSRSGQETFLLPSTSVPTRFGVFFNTTHTVQGDTPSQYSFSGKMLVSYA